MNKLYNEDCLLALKKLDDNSIDTMVTDPPYGYSFMGKDWDKVVPSVEIWRECLRVMKPGAFAFVMSAPRQDVLSQMVVRLTDAGFDMGYSSIYWTYSSGFPKAHNVGKKNKKMEGAYGGFQPKPAVEIIIVAMKPLTEKTFVAQALSNGKGITWMDDCRMPYSSESDKDSNGWAKTGADGSDGYNDTDTFKIRPISPEEIQERCVAKGRFPANLLVSDDVLNDGKITKDAGIGGRGKHNRGEGYGFKATGEIDTKKPTTGGSYSRYFDLDKWFSTTYPFLICPKACKSEKNAGCNELEGNQHKTGARTYDDVCANCGKKLFGDIPFRCQCEEKVTQKRITKGNFHPTVKPIKLMSYLIVLGSREGDIVLDPFSGSGTTLVAAKMLGRKYIGCEMSEEYCEIIEARLEAVKEEKEENEFFGTTT